METVRELHDARQMVENSDIKFSQSEVASQDELEAYSTLQTVRSASHRPEGWVCDVISDPRQPLSHGATPRKGCLKQSATAQARPQRTPNKRINFPMLSAHCLVTNTPYKGNSQDGKSWRRQQSQDKHEERTRQALSGSLEYQPYVKTDRWADRGWESTGLGEDTPMGGISEEMDMEAALWRARQMEFDARLEQQQDLAEEHRFAMETEVRRIHGADGLMGTREFVKHRLGKMQSYTVGN